MSYVSQNAHDQMFRSAGRKNQKAIVNIAVQAKMQGMTYGQLVSQKYLNGEVLEFHSAKDDLKNKEKEKNKNSNGYPHFPRMSPEQEKINERVQSWADWSMTPHSEEEIRDKCLDDIDGICFAYLCNCSYISEEFFEEFLALSTGLITRDNYAQLQYYINILRDKYTNPTAVHEQIAPKVDINALDSIINNYSDELKSKYPILFNQKPNDDLTM